MIDQFLSIYRNVNLQKHINLQKHAAQLKKKIHGNSDRFPNKRLCNSAQVAVWLVGIFTICSKHYTVAQMNTLYTHLGVNDPDHHWFRLWLVACSAPSHYLNKCWLIVKWTLRKKLKWNFNENVLIFIQENVVCKMSAIWFWPQCVDGYPTGFRPDFIIIQYIMYWMVWKYTMG